MAASPAPPDVATVKRYLPWVVASALFMEQLDSTIVNTAVPTMAASLQVDAAEPEGGRDELHPEPRRLHSGQWMDGRPLRHAPRVRTAVAIFTLSSILCGLAVNVPMLVAARILQGIGAAMMMPVGRLTIVRTFPKSDLLAAMNFVIIPALIGPCSAHGRRPHRALAVLAGDLLRQRAGGARGTRSHSSLHARLSRRETARPSISSASCCSARGTALLSWLLEMFGEHSIDATSAAILLLISLGLLAAMAGTRARRAYPLLQLALFRLRTFRVSVVGGLRHPAGHRRSAVPAAAALSARPRPAGVAIGVADDADRRRGDGHEIPVHARRSGAIRIPAGADREHGA